MFLSHVLAILFGIGTVPFILLLNSSSRGFSALGAVGFLIMFYAMYKLSSTRWIWVGPTLGQLESELEQITQQVAELERKIFPPYGVTEFTPPPNTTELQTMCRKLRKRQAKVADMISDQQRAAKGDEGN